MNFWPPKIYIPNLFIKIEFKKSHTKLTFPMSFFFFFLGYDQRTFLALFLFHPLSILKVVLMSESAHRDPPFELAEWLGSIGFQLITLHNYQLRGEHSNHT